MLSTTEQVDIVQEKILSKVVNGKQKDQTLKPKFLGITCEPGYMILTCVNQEMAHTSWD